MGLLTVISDQLNYTDDAYAPLHGTWKEQQVRSIETLTSLPSWISASSGWWAREKAPDSHWWTEITALVHVT